MNADEHTPIIIYINFLNTDIEIMQSRMIIFLIRLLFSDIVYVEVFSGTPPPVSMKTFETFALSRLFNCSPYLYREKFQRITMITHVYIRKTGAH